MQPESHFIVSSVLSIGFYYFTGSFTAAIACFVVGFLIDADHFFDYWIYKKKITYSKEFFQGFHKKFGKAYVVFHSFEILLVLLIGFYFLKLGVISSGIITGMFVHLLMDMIANPADPLAYFFVYRWINGFDLKLFKIGAKVY